MKIKVNWTQILLDVIRVILAGLAGGAGATLM